MFWLTRRFLDEFLIFSIAALRPGVYNKTLTNYDRSFPVSFSDLTFLFLFSAAVFRGLLHSALSLQKCCARTGQLCLLLHRRGRARHTAAVRRAASALRPRPRNGGERSPHAKSTADHRAGGGPLCLVYFKYAAFILENLGKLTGTVFSLVELALPLGVSFYLFQSAGYLIDVYRGEEAEKKPHRLRRLHHRVPPAHDGADLTLPRMARRTEGTHDHARGRILRL